MHRGTELRGCEEPRSIVSRDTAPDEVCAMRAKLAVGRTFTSLLDSGEGISQGQGRGGKRPFSCVVLKSMMILADTQSVPVLPMRHETDPRPPCAFVSAFWCSLFSSLAVMSVLAFSS